VSAAWDGELDLELSLGCAGGERGGDRTTVADEAFNSAPGKQRTGLTVR
jgi:AP2-like factor, euAP2 lineage